MEKKSEKNQTSKNQKDIVTSKPKTDLKKVGDQKAVSVVTAQLNFLHESPKKIRLVTNAVAGFDVEKAINHLTFVNQAAVRPFLKLIKSAVANAEHNFGLSIKDLFIKKINVNDGPVLKRWMPKAHGRATMIRKPSSHLSLILGVKPGAKIKKPLKKEETVQSDKAQEKPKDVSEQKGIEAKKESFKGFSKGQGDKIKSDRGFLKKFFQRKTGWFRQ